MEYFDEDLPSHSPLPGEVDYPDIDETIQYPWQGSQQPTSTDASVIDPRLYRDLFPGTDSQVPAQSVEDEEPSGIDEGILGLEDPDQGSSFEASSDESSSVVQSLSLTYS